MGAKNYIKGSFLLRFFSSFITFFNIHHQPHLPIPEATPTAPNLPMIFIEIKLPVNNDFEPNRCRRYKKEVLMDVSNASKSEKLNSFKITRLNNGF